MGLSLALALGNFVRFNVGFLTPCPMIFSDKFGKIINNSGQFRTNNSIKNIALSYI